jgi:hypothetical protein
MGASEPHEDNFGVVKQKDDEGKSRVRRKN